MAPRRRKTVTSAPLRRQRASLRPRFTLVAERKLPNARLISAKMCAKWDFIYRNSEWTDQFPGGEVIVLPDCLLIYVALLSPCCSNTCSAGWPRKRRVFLVECLECLLRFVVRTAERPLPALTPSAGTLEIAARHEVMSGILSSQALRCFGLSVAVTRRRFWPSRDRNVVSRPFSGRPARMRLPWQAAAASVLRLSRVVARRS